jgi:hypothetical protein
MKENDVRFFKVVAVIICSFLIIGSLVYLSKGYKSHDQELKEQTEQLKQAKQDLDKQIKNGNIGK